MVVFTLGFLFFFFFFWVSLKIKCIVHQCQLIMLSFDIISVQEVTPDMLQRVWQEIDYRWDIKRKNMNCVNRQNVLYQVCNHNYACGNWKEAHPRPDSSIEIDWTTEAESTILRKLREHLQENTTRDEPLPVKLARTFYNSCMDMKMREHLGMEPIYKILEEVGLERLPPLPRYSSIFYSLSARQSNWIPTIVKIKKRLGIDVLLGLHVSSLRSSYEENNIWIGEPLTFTEQNTFLRTIMNKDNEKDDPILSDGSVLPENLTDSVISRLTQEEILSLLDLEIKSMSKIIAYFYNISLIDAKEVAKKTFRFETQLMQIGSTRSQQETISNIEQQIIFTTFSKVDLTEYVTLMLEDITNLKFDINEDLVYADVAYINFYLWWKVVSTLTPHTNWHMDANEDEYNTDWAQVEMPEARSIVCTKIVEKLMDKAVSYLMATPEFINKSENTIYWEPSRGIYFDKNGQQQNLFSSLESHVTSRDKCFTEQYDNFEWDGEELNGKLTLSENLADSGGLNTALYAYRNYMEARAEEPKLPGLEEFTNEQLFFLAYANSYCSTLTKRGRQLSMQMSHPPNYFRVLGPLMNSKDFSNAWKCDGTSRMNPVKKCTLW
ncbi:hypothetical protein C0J52_02845 [Blattella germanica]|nr:hypothetical protein C0J52_02845 [Blattella germanica]